MYYNPYYQAPRPRGRGRPFPPNFRSKFKRKSRNNKPPRNPNFKKQNRRPKRNNKSKNSNRISAPLSISGTVQTYVRMSQSTISFCQAVPNDSYNQSHAIIAVHPLLCESSRIFSICNNFSKFKLRSAKLHYVPMLSATNNGQVCLSYAPTCTELVNVEANIFTNLTQQKSSIFSIWQSGTIIIDITDKNLAYPVQPSNSSHVPYNFEVALASSASVLSTTGSLFVEVEYELIDPIASNVNSVNSGIIITTSANGLRGTNCTVGGTFMVITKSTPFSNIQLGELVTIPVLVANNTDYVLSMTHNSTVISEYGTPSNYSVMAGNCFTQV